MTTTKAHDRAAIEALPRFTDDPVDRLAHTLAVYDPESTPDDRVAITATSGWRLYPEGVNWTGLTFGDLRAILERVRQPD
jgi:hypothetical protein